MTQRKLIILTLIGTGITFLFLRVSSIPLGIPGEWVWNRVNITPEDYANVFFGLIFVLLSGLLYLVASVIGTHHIESKSRWKKLLLLLILCGTGYSWLFSLQDSLPFTNSLTKAPLILYYPSSSGYFHEAQYQIKDTKEFMKTYEEKIAEGDVLHVGTHPPGLFLVNKGLIQLCEYSPALSKSILHSMPDSAQQSLEVIANNEANSGVNFPQSSQASLWLSIILTHCLAILTIVPLFFLCEMLTDSSAAWKTVCFWPLVPALAIFLPKSDAIYPFFSILIILFWTKSLLHKCYFYSILAGLFLFISLCFSLAILPTIVLCGLVFTGFCYSEIKQKNHSVNLFLQPVAVLLSLLICILIVRLSFQINLLVVWKWNYLNHAGFYEQFTRTWWKWVLVNPMELTFSLGIPIVIIAGLGLIRIREHSLFSMPVILCYSILITWGLLWLSGKNSGEAARLWLILMPWFLVISSFSWYHFPHKKNKDVPQGNLSPIWLSLLLIQFAVCIITVFSVFGFHHNV